MGLDIRLPLGMMLAVLGLLLVGYGALSDPAIYQGSLGINVNARWGVVLMLFGAGMLWLAWRAAKAGKEPTEPR